MNARSTIRKTLRTALLAACIPALSLPALAATAGGTKTSTTAHPPATPVARGGSALSGQTMPAALRPVFYEALAKDAGATYHINKNNCAVLPRQTLKGCFDTSGAHFTGATSLALRLVSYGRGSTLSTVPSVQPEIAGNQASYRHGAMTEWWRVLPVGFEQGFTIARRPSGNGELTLALAMSQPETAAPQFVVPAQAGTQSKSGIPTKGRDTNSHWTPASAGMTKKKNDNVLAWGKLRYGQLVVTDAKGKIVPAMLATKGSRILIAVNDAHATYPLTVDPLVWLEQKVTANDGATGDGFGFAVALSGTTALIGAIAATVNGNSNQGAAYVFNESNGTWTQTQKLTASDGAANDQFGASVALSGTNALIGAPQATANGQGAAYVFNESNGTWAQTQKLTASDGAAGDNFGVAVALAGATALVGASFATVNGNSSQGAAYVFNEANESWTQTQKLTASDGVTDDGFGSSVALSGTSALIGADGNVNGRGAAYVFNESNGTWTQTQKLTASDGVAYDSFGDSVALEGTTALVGAGFATVNGNSSQGAAYVFNESNGTWTQTQKLTASDGAVLDEFGISVALFGPTALVGAWGATVNGKSSQGAAYVFNESNGTWSQTQKLTASDGAAGDQFGTSVAILGTTALAGAWEATVNGNIFQGAAYFYGHTDLGLTVSAPQTVGQGQQYMSQTIATNNASAASPAVSATITVPAAASFVSATATQGSCNEASGVVSCDFGAIDANAGTATANVTLKATGAPGTVIQNVAGIAKATPPLTASAPTQITGSQSCPDGYTTHSGTLAANAGVRAASYEAPAGEENAILYAPTGFELAGRVDSTNHGQYQRIFSGTEVHRWGPAGAYAWGVKAGDAGGAYTLCILHP